MTFLKRFDLPASLPDLDDWPSRQADWHAWISDELDLRAGPIPNILNHLKKNGGPTPQAQFYNPATQNVPGRGIEQAITWNAFPLELIRRFGRTRALVEADRLWPIMKDTDVLLNQKHLTEPVTRNTLFFRPQSEYCEWRVDRDPGTGRMLQVTFTSESPEYWHFLYGQGCTDPADILKSRQNVLELYRELVDPTVQAAGLLASGLSSAAQKKAKTLIRNGRYNDFNQWNTTHGIVHLTCQSNTLSAELELVANSTLWYRNASDHLMTYPDAICCAVSGLGCPNRRSDMAIIGAINALARQGMMVTLANPPGICMDHIDTSSWQLPGGVAARDCWNIVRGSEGGIARLVVKMPPKTGYTLSDLVVAGEPLLHGGQLAECVTVRLIVAATAVQPPIANPMQPTNQTDLLVNGHPPRIVQRSTAGAPPAGTTVAFAGYEF